MTETLKRSLFGYRARIVHEILADRETMFQRAVADHRDAQARLEELTAEFDALQAEVTSIRSQLTERDREIEGALARRSELEAELRQAQERATGLDGELQASQGRVAELDAQLQEAHGRVEELGSEIGKLRDAEREQSERARRADSEAESLRGELAALREVVGERDAALADREAVVAELRARVGSVEAGVSPSDGETTAPISPADLDHVLAQTGERITRMVEDARRTAERQLAETERRRDEIRAEIDRLTAWRDRLVPLARDVRTLLSETEDRAADVDGRLREAIEPMTLAVASLRNRLADLIEGANDLDDGDLGEPEPDGAGVVGADAGAAVDDAAEPGSVEPAGAAAEDDAERGHEPEEHARWRWTGS